MKTPPITQNALYTTQSIHKWFQTKVGSPYFWELFDKQTKPIPFNWWCCSSSMRRRRTKLWLEFEASHKCCYWWCTYLLSLSDTYSFLPAFLPQCKVETIIIYIGTILSGFPYHIYSKLTHLPSIPFHISQSSSLSLTFFSFFN